MKTTFAIGLSLLLTLTSCLSSGHRVAGNGHHITQRIEIDAQAFHALSIGGAFKAVVTQTDGEAYCTITTSDNLQQYLYTQQSDGRLVIKWKDNIRVSNEDLQVHIYTPSLTTIEMAGAGSLLLSDSAHFDNLNISIAGSSSIKGKALNCRALSFAIAGSGDIDVQDINCRLFTVNIAGSGDVIASGKADSTRLAIAGSGDIDIRGLQSDHVKKDVFGSGKILTK